MGRIVAIGLIALVGCHKAPPSAPAPSAAAYVNDALEEQALKDLQNDLVLVRMQLAALAPLAQLTAAQRAGRVNAALYTCERLALAGRELADDAAAQPALGEADALCAYQVPLAAGEHKLAALEQAHAGEPAPRSAPADCGPVRDALNRVGAKYRNDAHL